MRWKRSKMPEPIIEPVVAPSRCTSAAHSDQTYHNALSPPYTLCQPSTPIMPDGY